MDEESKKLIERAASHLHDAHTLLERLNNEKKIDCVCVIEELADIIEEIDMLTYEGDEVA